MNQQLSLVGIPGELCAACIPPFLDLRVGLQSSTPRLSAPAPPYRLGETESISADIEANNSAKPDTLQKSSLFCKRALWRPTDTNPSSGRGGGEGEGAASRHVRPDAGARAARRKTKSGLIAKQTERDERKASEKLEFLRSDTERLNRAPNSPRKANATKNKIGINCEANGTRRTATLENETN